MTQIDATQLIAEDGFSSQWEILDPDGASSRWSFSPAGVLQQTASVGSGKQGSGTFAILNEAIAQEETEVRLLCHPGATFQVGMALCFVDRDNCVIFSLEQRGAAFEGYHVLVTELENGTPTTLLKGVVDQRLAPPVTLATRQVGRDTVLLLGSQLVWTLLDRPLAGHRIGLYSQRNTDALFQELTLRSLPPAPEPPTPPAPEPEPPTPSAPGIEPLPVSAPRPVAESAISPYLTIQEPDALSVIEFKEPFRVALDSLYSSLYLNSDLARPMRGTYSTRPTRSVLLDVRPKRWYRETKNIQDAMRLARFDLSRADKVLAALENGGAYPEGVDHAEHDAAIREARKKYLVAQDVLERLVQERNGLVQEMRVAGYLVHKEDVPEEMAELGYDFFIAGGVAGYKDFEPIDFDRSLNLGEDDPWNALESRLRERLFANPRFAPSSKERYLPKLEPLVDSDHFLPHIEQSLDAFRGEITLLESAVRQQEKQLESLQRTIASWQADRRLLEESHIQFRPYSGSEYPIDGSGAGPRNHSSFRSWLAANTTAFKAFNYKFTSSGDNYSVAIDRYEGFEWYQDYHVTRQDIPIKRWVIFTPLENWLGKHNYEEVIGYTHQYRYTIKGDAEIRNFFDTAIRLCDAFLGQYLPQEQEALQAKTATLQNNKTGVELRKRDLETNGLRLARESFIDDWNRASILEAMALGERVVSPNSDPLTDLIAELENEGEPTKVYTLEYRADGYYTQDGQSLLDFIAVAEKLPHLPILLLPVFDRHGRKLSGVSNAVVNPMRSAKVINLPTITFVETYRTEVRWKGYGLGPLTQTINLFPGERKELVIEHSTRLAEKLSRTDSAETSRSTTVTRSFEEQLQQELLQKNTIALSESVTEDNERKKEVSRTITDEVSRVDRLALTFSLEQGAETSTDVSGTAKGKGGSSTSGSKDTKKSDAKGIGFEASTTTTTGHGDVKADAMTISQKQTAQKSNQESKETLKKALSNVINKAASEASENNKVAFSAVASRDLETTSSRKETVTLENPNVGRTVNYNLFQAQNIFETRTALIDVKIVLDPGIEIVQHSDLTDLRVFDLEEFGRIYFNSDTEDPRIAVLAAIVARQVFKTYGGPGGGALRFTDVVPIDGEMYNVLNLSFPWQAEGSLAESLLAPLREALTYLKSRSLRFNEVELVPPAVHTVNSGSYYMDSEVGQQPATEKYLEDRRDIQTEKQRAEVEEIRARTAAGAFHPPFPEGLTSLSLDGSGPPVEPATGDPSAA